MSTSNRCLLTSWSDAVQTIIDRSMHTTHPRFFNQNFAGPEPIAVVGDWLAAALNTTNATFEVAPVFTMMERSVINKMAGLAGTPSTLRLERSRQAFFVLAAHRPRCMRCNWHGTEPVPTFCRPERLANGLSCSCPRPLTTPRSSQPRLMGLGLQSVIEVDTDATGAMIPAGLAKAVA